MSSNPKELHKWIKIMLDAYNLNKEETDIREARKMTEPVVIQRLFILKETLEEEYLENGRSQDSKTEGDSKSEELWGLLIFAYGTMTQEEQQILN